MAEAIAALADDPQRMARLRAVARSTAPSYSREDQARRMAAVLQNVLRRASEAGAA
jgi:putative colanic acid biosynthesis glycosyltransferase WcaI